ncbi:hypothetical protein [Phyllobacterium myrsinacearum]|uniref:Uncharacterized protein n=1 Tax=Phyllobacterium myrsinacearum TaxID=28101 RepID=A0A839EMH3_9HYPH|nr:hypothetical protein [Phyllobacterium myrsinacearum]MBA8881773.1 hypothetical protein [Phyllobacterium myrsinacearum]
MTATFTVKNFIDTAQMKRDLAYSPADLSNAMMQQASLFAHYGVIAAQASRQVDTVKLLLESTEAAVYRRERETALQDGEKPTVADLDKRVARNGRVVNMKKALIEAKQIEANAKTATEAFRHRRDMLIQSGSTEREEMKGELAISVRTARDEAASESRNNLLARQKQRMKEEAAGSESS